MCSEDMVPGKKRNFCFSFSVDWFRPVGQQDDSVTGLSFRVNLLKFCKEIGIIDLRVILGLCNRRKRDPYAWFSGIQTVHISMESEILVLIWRKSFKSSTESVVGLNVSLYASYTKSSRSIGSRIDVEALSHQRLLYCSTIRQKSQPATMSST